MVLDLELDITLSLSLFLTVEEHTLIPGLVLNTHPMPRGISNY
jgi:hypothetical protein